MLRRLDPGDGSAGDLWFVALWVGVTLIGVYLVYRWMNPRRPRR